MKKIIQDSENSFHWQESNGDSVEISISFEKNSEQYNELISSGCEVVLLEQSEIEAGKKEAANATHKAYLLETDWYVMRYSETGKAVPQEILQKRAEARAAIA
jgi:hypothetical protein